MKALMLNSGGADTLWCAKLLSEAGDELHSLFIALGHTADPVSKTAAEAIAQRYCASHRNMKVTGLMPRFAVNVPEYISIPYQTLMLLAMAASVAVAQDIQHIVSGVRIPMMKQTPEKLQALMGRSVFATWGITWHFPCGDIPAPRVIVEIKGHDLYPATNSCNLSPSCLAIRTPETYCHKCRLRAEAEYY